MLETFTSSFQDLARNIRIVDIFDIAFITVFLYLVLNWLLQSTSRRTIIGFSFLVGVYVLARITGMYLTELLVQGLFVVILIGIVVVFQSDIRRMVDRIGNWHFFRNNATTSSNKASDIITEASSQMAETRTGALMVIRGNEAWDRHIHGGIDLNGQLSLPLLYSIFNPQAPGHDGAIILEGDKVLRFGTHLPLSTNLGKNSSGGTRHAAALGLSEQCDALIIVVSEERGVISVAKDGRLKELESASDLKNIIEDFVKEHYQPRDSSLMEWWRERNLRTGLASVFIAVLLWFAFAYQSGTVFRTFAVPIEYRNLQSNNIALQDSLPMEARVTLSGSEQAFRALEPSQLVISFNMDSEAITRNKEELLITDQNINLPSGLNLYEVVPRTLDIEPRKLEKVQVRVYVPTNGKLPGSLKLVSIRPARKSITVLAESAEEVPDSITTEIINLSTINQSNKINRKLVIPPGVTLPKGASGELTIAVNVQDTSGT